MVVPARLNIVTLGVTDLARSVSFYEGLGWQKTKSSMDEISDAFGSVSFIDTAAPGMHTYSVRFTVLTADRLVTVDNLVLNAVDLGEL